MDKKRILVVEDEPEMRMMLALELETSGYEVFQAEDGEMGLKVAAQVKPDLIISDVLMPKLDGNQFLKKIRESDFGKKIPFIVLTARAKMREYFEAIEVSAFLKKPFDAEELLSVVKGILDKQGGPPEKSPSGSPVGANPSGISSVAEAVVDAGMVSHNSLDVDAASSPGMKAKGFSDLSQKRSSSGTRKTILLMEDEKLVSYELTKVLSMEGYNVKVVETPTKCLEEANRFVPDAIVVKFFLKEMKADEFAGILKEMPRFRNVPIIIYKEIGAMIKKVNSSGEEIVSFTLNEEGDELVKELNELLKRKR